MNHDNDYDGMTQTEWLNFIKAPGWPLTDTSLGISGLGGGGLAFKVALDAIKERANLEEEVIKDIVEDDEVVIPPEPISECQADTFLTAEEALKWVASKDMRNIGMAIVTSSEGRNYLYVPGESILHWLEKGAVASLTMGGFGILLTHLTTVLKLIDMPKLNKKLELKKALIVYQHPSKNTVKLYPIDGCIGPLIGDTFKDATPAGVKTIRNNWLGKLVKILTGVQNTGITMIAKKFPAAGVAKTIMDIIASSLGDEDAVGSFSTKDVFDEIFLTTMTFTKKDFTEWMMAIIRLQEMEHMTNHLVHILDSMEDNKKYLFKDHPAMFQMLTYLIVSYLTEINKEDVTS